MEVITFKVKFDGIYFWGQGWKDNETRVKWQTCFYDFNKRYTFWKHFHIDDTDYLVSTTGTIYLHPMGFDLVMRDLCKSYSIDKDGKQIRQMPMIDELKEICEFFMEICGGTATYSEIEINEIPTPKFR